MARKSLLRYWGLDQEPLTRSAVTEWMQKTNTVPYWDNQRGQLFKPRIGPKTRERFQEILDVHSRQDVEDLKKELPKKD